MTSLTIDQATGLLTTVLFRPSPNCDDRPIGTAIDLLVIHGISLPPGKFEGEAIDALFHNCLDENAHPYFQQIARLRVSAHVLIRRDGQLIQYVPFIKRAWHAGISQFAGRQQCNDFSIGIELEGADDIPYATYQYKQLAVLTHILMRNYPGIHRNRIVGHSDIAPGRKTDPGPAFDWSYYHQLLTKET
jgi:N-acetyl-anhydromuramoyl-L-alanine amidase